MWVGEYLFLFFSLESVKGLSLCKKCQALVTVRGVFEIKGFLLSKNKTVTVTESHNPFPISHLPVFLTDHLWSREHPFPPGWGHWAPRPSSHARQAGARFQTKILGLGYNLVEYWAASGRSTVCRLHLLVSYRITYKSMFCGVLDICLTHWRSRSATSSTWSLSASVLVLDLCDAARCALRGSRFLVCILPGGVRRRLITSY